VTVYLPEEDQPLSVSLTESFWRETPVLRSPRLRHFLKRHGLVPWPKKQPPHFELESLGGGVFRLKWLEKVPAQSQRELDG
jgi:hypothetical protein